MHHWRGQRTYASKIFTDNFPDTTTFNAGPTIGNINVTAGCVDLYSAGSFGLATPGVDLDETCFRRGTITSTSAISFSPGFTYTLSFDYSSNNNTTSAVNTAQIMLGSLVDTTITGIKNTPQAFSESFSVSSAQSYNLSFQELGTSDNEGVVVGGISIVETASGSPTPEPGTAAFGALCIGLSTLGVWRRKASR